MSRLTNAHVLYGAALTLMLIAAPVISEAGSAPATHTQSISINYNDLSLDRPDGVKALYHRIANAAEKVCGPREVSGSHLPLPSYQTCYDAAVRDAVAAVASPALSAYYRSLPSYAGSHLPEVARR